MVDFGAVRGRFLVFALFILLIALTSDGAFNLTENSLVLTDMGQDTVPGRLIRITDLTDTGWETGPTISGLSFYHPLKFSFDASGRIYIADRDNLRIVRMDDLAGAGWTALAGAGSNVLALPGSIGPCPPCNSNTGTYATAVDASGRIYIATSNPWRIVRIDDMAGSGWVAYQGTPPFSPRYITLDRQGRIYLADNQRHQIIRMNDIQGNGLVAFGSLGNGVGQFNEPAGVFVDSAGRIYIGDETNNRIVRMNDMTGAGWTTFGSFGSGTGEFALPHDVAVDSLGRIYIQDTTNMRIVRINSMTGAGWVSFGNWELQGQKLQLTASKGMHVFGQGPTLKYISIFPQIAVGGGYRTSIIGVNTGRITAAAEVSFTKATSGPCSGTSLDCGAPFPVTVDDTSASTFTRSVQPMGTMRLEATASGTVAAGIGKLQSNEELNGVAIVKTESGGVISSEAAVGPSPQTDRFTIYIDNLNSASTGYAVANPVPDGGFFGMFGWVNLQLTLRNNAGVTLDSKIFNLAPGRQFVEFASQTFPSHVGPGFEGSIEFKTISGGPKVEAIALRYDNAASDVFTTIPVIPSWKDPVKEVSGGHSALPVSQATTLYYPQLADGGTYRTNFILVNTTDTATTATIDFFADDGTPLALPIAGEPKTRHTVSINAKGVARFVTDGTSAGVKTGWARVTASLVIGGAAIFQTLGAGRINSEAGVSSSPLGSHFTTYADSLGSAQSGVALANPNSTAVNVTFNLRNTNGQIVSSTTRTIPAMGHTARFFTELFPQGFEEFEGTLELVTNGSAVSGVALRYDNPDLSVFVTMPLIPIE